MSELVFSAADDNPLVAAFLRAHGVVPGSLVLGVHREDEMLKFAIDAAGGDFDAVAGYFVAGRDIAAMARQLVLWKFGGFDRLGAMLDFASGYGRVTRWLVRELPPERLWVSDIYPGAVAFQRQHFGVGAFASVTRPEDLAPPRRFDLVLVVSLFTHLPRPAFEAWLKRLIGLLEPGGLLVFSVHDADLFEAGQQMPADGFLFRALSESQTLAAEEYGTTWVSEAYVRGAVARAARNATCARLPRALCRFQDLYLVAPQGADMGTLAFDGGPDGILEHVEAATGVLRLRGWAASPERGGGVREVRAVLGGVVARTAEFSPHSGVGIRYPQLGDAPSAAWSLAVPLEPRLRFSAAALLVEAESAAGVGTVLHLGSVDSALRRSSELEVLMARAAQRAAESERAKLLDRQLGLRYEALTTRALSKLRDRWLAFKS